MDLYPFLNARSLACDVSDLNGIRFDGLMRGTHYHKYIFCGSTPI